MRIFFIFIILWLDTSILWATPQFSGDSVIIDPLVRRRCQTLLESRKEKLQLKQRFYGLIAKNKKLQNLVPENKQKLKKEFDLNLKNLVREHDLAKDKVSNIEERLIRKGCPGVAL